MSRQEAAQAALDEIGEGRVTWISREDERGAAWEVEITRPNGREIDVLVARTEASSGNPGGVQHVRKAFHVAGH